MLNPSVSWSQFREPLRSEGWVVIPDVLDERSAERIRSAMANDTPYKLAYRRDGQDLEADIDIATEPALLRSIAASDERFTYAYDGYHLVGAYLAGDRRVPALRELLEYFNSPPFLDAVRSLTGDVRIRRADAQATRYRAGHFLKTHNDFHAQEQRQFAYVLYLTRQWRSDNGGLLAFTDESDTVLRTIKPSFNQLLVFKVPLLHHVTPVGPAVNEPRLAISGWFSH
jgi:Rps23 Pro-64 3,4-dihydroxylase Tpa1-like proline 4-hydroxylase